MLLLLCIPADSTNIRQMMVVRSKSTANDDDDEGIDSIIIVAVLRVFSSLWELLNIYLWRRLLYR